MFGNPTVMPVKILWDYMIYWSITGFIFMHDRQCHQTMYMRNLGKLKRLGKLNHSMQEFFRKWHSATENKSVGGTIDISKMPLIREANQRLKDDMDNRTFFKQFTANLAQLELLAAEIVEHSGLENELNFITKPNNSLIRVNAFERVLNPEQTPTSFKQTLEV